MVNNLHDKARKIYPDVISRALQNVQNVQNSGLQERVNHLCHFAENTIPFIGAISVHYYVRYGKPAAQVDHLIFFALERTTLGVWLYLMRYLGEYFLDTDPVSSGFQRIHRFLSDYASQHPEDNTMSYMVKFRNDVRHGSACLNSEIFSHALLEWDKFLDQMAFLQDYSLEDHELIDNNHRLTLLPIVEMKDNITFLRPNAKNTIPEDYYRSMAMEKRYASYLALKQGHTEEVTLSEQLLSRQKFSLPDSGHKFLLQADPGAGLSCFCRNFTAKDGKVIRYLVDESPVKGYLPVALLVLARLAITNRDHFPTKTEELLGLLTKFLAESSEKYYFVIDGVFSWHSPVENYEEWMPLLSQEFSENAIWLFTATKGLAVPRFYDSALSLPSFLLEEDASPDLRQKIIDARDNGQIINVGKGEHLNRYFARQLRQLGIVEHWQKKTLVALASSDTALGVKELAEQIDLFTPQAERFLHSISPVLTNDKGKFAFYHPLLAEYIYRSERNCP